MEDDDEFFTSSRLTILIAIINLDSLIKFNNLIFYPAIISLKANEIHILISYFNYSFLI